MADEYPRAEVLGVDLSVDNWPSWQPLNFSWMNDDVEQPWAIPPYSLDFVHIRDMDGAIRNWPNLMKEAYWYVGVPFAIFALHATSSISGFLRRRDLLKQN